MSQTKHQNGDVLTRAGEMLQAPSRNTKRKILVAINFVFLLVALTHLATQLATYGTLPDPARDMIMIPLIILINGISAAYNLRILVKKRTKQSKRFDSVSAWSSVLIIMVYAISIVHMNPNTATSFLFDFTLSVILLFVAGAVLNRYVAVAWFVISVISLYTAFTNRGADFEYQLFTKQEAIEYKKNFDSAYKIYIQTEKIDTLALKPAEILELIANSTPEKYESGYSPEQKAAIKHYQTTVNEKILALPSGLFLQIWIIFLLLTFFVILFESGMVGQILKVIPTVISNINIAAEQKNKLEKDNMRMGMELDVAKQIQTMVLPHKNEFTKCNDLEIAARMDTATEVGGDFYDVLPQKNETTYFGIGDVTDHGLQSGVVMLMTQSAFRTTLDGTGMNIRNALIQINNVLYQNIQNRLSDRRNLTLSLLEYKKGKLSVVGQHESLLIYRKAQNTVEEIKTMDLGMYVGLTEDISEFIQTYSTTLEIGDVVMLYTDGASEAENMKNELYGTPNIMQSFKKHINGNSEEILNAVYKDIYTHIGEQELFDDITMVIFKRLN